MDEISELVVCAQMPLIKVHADVSSVTRNQNFGLSFHLQPNFVYVSSEGSGQSAYQEHVHVHRFR